MRKPEKPDATGGGPADLESMRTSKLPVRKAAGYRATATLATYRNDPLYGRIERAVAAILRKGKVVTPIDVIVAMNLLESDKLEDWYTGRVPYLEKVIRCNLTSLARLLRILRFHAHHLNLVPLVTLYTRRGEGPKRQLRFTKTGDPKLEEAYARRFVWPGIGPFHPPRSEKPLE